MENLSFDWEVALQAPHRTIKSSDSKDDISYSQSPYPIVTFEADV